MNGGAVGDDRYRVLLWRDVAPLTGDGICTFVMLNPSTADATQDDPTIRKIMGFAARWGFARLDVVNLFDFRATRPEGLLSAEHPVSDYNDRYIEAAVGRARTVVVAWGGFIASLSPTLPRGILRDRPRAVLERLHPRPLHCLGTTKDGEPRHPLYLPNNTALRPYTPRDRVHSPPGEP